MKYRFVSAALLAGTGAAASLQSSVVDVVARALPDAPNGYTPADVDCPSTRPSVRSAATLSQQESDFLDARREKTIPATRDFLESLGIEGFDVRSYFDQNSGNSSSLPNIALAFSGGGYRALLNGAGAVQKFDSREPESSVSKGGLGGLLQSSTYLAGLSGGSWLVGSIYVNNYSTISNLMASDQVWGFDQSIFEGPDGGSIQVLDSAGYYKDIGDAVDGKNDSGFDTSITDYWGRALSFQLINAPEGGPSITWSSIRDQPGFSTGDMPYPVVVSDARNPGEKVVSLNSTVFEFTPYEFGTFDPTTFGFVDTRFIGTAYTNGEVPQNESCVQGFDNAGYVMGTSSSLFNQFLLNIDAAGGKIPKFITDALAKILTVVSDADNDIAAYDPNPFWQFNETGRSNIADQRQLTLVDGGSDLQNIPLQPLIQPVRNVDVIFAIDSSADTNNWPNGTAMVATYERSLGEISNGTAFPSIPDVNTFVNLGLNTKPTFFGCDGSNTSSPTPLVVYLPNAPLVFNSNVTTFTPSYTTGERNAIIANGGQIATRGNNTVDSQWQQCVGCAILQRSLNHTETQMPAVCRTCFDRYCWNGTTDSSTPPQYDPSIIIPQAEIKVEEDAAGTVIVSKVMLGLGLLAGLWLI